ncbi:MAG: hypothetical protein HY017_25020 [Betaproteobacteria bacterium]|nr:hypothetical protein [Betaproteobacteria bacterium]
MAHIIELVQMMEGASLWTAPDEPRCNADSTAQRAEGYSFRFGARLLLDRPATWS